MLKTRSRWLIVIVSATSIVALIWMWMGRGKTVPGGDLVFPLSSSLPLLADYHWADSQSLILMYGIFGPEATIVQLNLKTGTRNPLASFRPPQSPVAGVPWDRFRVSGDNRRLALLPLPVTNAVTFAGIDGRNPFDVTVGGQSVREVIWAADSRHALVLGRAYPATKLLMIDAELQTQAQLQDFPEGDTIMIGSSGKDVLFGYVSKDQEMSTLELYRVNYEGNRIEFQRSISAPNPVYNSWEARLSPDGSRIAWLGCRGVPHSTWKESLLTVFSRRRKTHYISGCELWMTDRKGGDPKRLSSWTEPTPGASELKWLPDGKAVTFFSTGGIWRVPTD
jgi:hypothetical protein